MPLPQPQRIVLPEALDPRILKAAAELLRRGQARIILLGQEQAVQVRLSPIDVTNMHMPPDRSSAIGSTSICSGP